VEEVCFGPSDLQSEDAMLIEEVSLTSNAIVRASGTISLMMHTSLTRPPESTMPSSGTFKINRWKLAGIVEARRAYQTPVTLDSEASIRNHRNGIDMLKHGTVKGT
jgi:hypothetical protein